MKCTGKAATYERLMQEAQAEFDAWDGGGKPVAVNVGKSVFVRRTPPRNLRCECGKRARRNGLCEGCRRRKRAESRPPCECGSPFFAKGKCQKCYFRDYNKSRVRPIRRKSRAPLCGCNRGNPVLAKGMCLACYSKRRRERSKQAKVA